MRLPRPGSHVRHAMDLAAERGGVMPIRIHWSGGRGCRTFIKRTFPEEYLGVGPPTFQALRPWLWDEDSGRAVLMLDDEVCRRLMALQTKGTEHGKG